jgi:heme-degrading monooxygenase HmoA
VVSSWSTIEDWIRWQNSDKRTANEANIEKILEVPTKYEIYDIRSTGSKEIRESDSDLLYTDEVS